MFGKERGPTVNTRAHAHKKDGGVTILTAGCHFNGRLVCRGATRIGGHVEGHVTAEGLLIIEDDAVVSGEIFADEIIIHGQVSGTVQAKKRCEMAPTARVTADISSAMLVVQQGALFNGRSVMAANAATDSLSTPNLSHPTWNGKNNSKEKIAN